MERVCVWGEGMCAIKANSFADLYHAKLTTNVLAHDRVCNLKDGVPVDASVNPKDWLWNVMMMPSILSMQTR